MSQRRRAVIVAMAVAVVAVGAAPLLIWEPPIAFAATGAALQLAAIALLVRIWVSLERTIRSEHRRNAAVRDHHHAEARTELAAVAVDIRTAVAREARGLVQDIVRAEARSWRAQLSTLTKDNRRLGARTRDQLIDVEARLRALEAELERGHEVTRTTVVDRLAKVVERHDHAVGERDKKRRDMAEEHLRRLRRDIDGVRVALRKGRHDDFAQLEALAALYWDMRPANSLPRTRSWAASPDLLRYLHDLVRMTKPDLVVECGSGLSTLVIADALRTHHPAGRIVALEHLQEFVDAAQTWLEVEGCAGVASVRLAPLETVQIGGSDYSWYAASALPDGPIDVLFVDGPPGTSGPEARYPAMSMLADRLAPDAVVLLDDCARADEHAILERWADEHPEFRMDLLPHEKRTGRLRRGLADEAASDPTEADDVPAQDAVMPSVTPDGGRQQQ